MYEPPGLEHHPVASLKLARAAPPSVRFKLTVGHVALHPFADHHTAHFSNFKLQNHCLFRTGCSITLCSKTIFKQIFSIILLLHNSKPGKWFLMKGKDSSLRTNRYCRRQRRRPSLSARQFRCNIAQLWQPAFAKRFASKRPFLGEP